MINNDGPMARGRRYTMDITIEKQDGTAILAARGRLDAAGAPEIEATGKALVGEGLRRLVLDMEQVEYISSAGLRSLLVLAKTVKSAGGALVLCSLAPAVHEVMTISGFDSILALAGNRADALERLGS
jgi:stage II sporulation protein AA (anti-sigma F factor antagonist)